MARLFVGVYPPPSVLAALDALPRPDEPGVRWVPPEQYHVTLRFLEDADRDQVAGALDAAATRLPPATVRLGPRVSRLGRNVVCVPADGLDDLAREVVAATTDALGAPADPRPFHGHLTLARLRNRAACGLAGTPFDATFAADAVHLVESVTRSAGAEHRRLRSWPLPS